MATRIELEDFTPAATPIDFVEAQSWENYASNLPAEQRAFAASCGFEPKPERLLLLPGPSGAVARALFGVEREGARLRDPFLPGKLGALLPPGLYRFDQGPADPAAGALAFLLSQYKYARFVAPKASQPRLCAPEGVDAARISRIAAAVAFGRDLVNAPANEIGPEALASAAVELAERHGAQVRVIVGDALVAENFPLIHAVGKGAAEAPRLVDFVHGPEDGLKVTLVGKGVCFDTGGLDIKPSSAMLLMKKDMGGAAIALSLASMLMEGAVPIRLRVILPIVENSVSAPAFRPSDIYRSRNGLAVEIGNTDAEGRLVLADALALASEDQPDLLFDFATLTGAARVALGPDLPPFYTGSDELARDIERHAKSANDPLWRLPLWEPYDSGLDGKISDVVNVTSHGFAGSITAALFLRRFVSDPERWAHFDAYCWNGATKPGRPEGGEIQIARGLCELIEARAAALAESARGRDAN
ncbi:leucyl aminopeptidase family protein [Methylocystis heyeri]|uniref:Leucyl aminopeptidase family protein n=1 Tax=Methylocystis heyeri TaxID=391905 RepID=A0A6B8KF08_9HYPH|nr:leucyl aminopeptidase family protein [Methylocystis heyeri]QGM46209.1 leucyl aminopeptidase family protein [Methylocystis heyeri]